MWSGASARSCFGESSTGISEVAETRDLARKALRTSQRLQNTAARTALMLRKPCSEVAETRALLIARRTTGFDYLAGK